MALKRSTLRIIAAVLVFVMVAGLVVAIFASGSASDANSHSLSATSAILR